MFWQKWASTCQVRANRVCVLWDGLVGWWEKREKRTLLCRWTAIRKVSCAPEKLLPLSHDLQLIQPDLCRGEIVKTTCEGEKRHTWAWGQVRPLHTYPCAHTHNTGDAMSCLQERVYMCKQMQGCMFGFDLWGKDAPEGTPTGVKERERERENGCR